MAVSVPASMIPCLNSGRSTLLGAASAAYPSHSTKLSSFSSLQFPMRTRFLQIGSPRVSSSRPRILPLVEAKKHSFSSFDDLLANSEKPLLVDFYATWCGPCQFMVPVLNEVSTRLQDKIQIVKIDTEKYPSIADEYKIAALPTFIIFKDGKPCDRFYRIISCISDDVNACPTSKKLSCEDHEPWQCFVGLPKEGALTADQLIERIEVGLNVKQ